jgi:hypothetical protein
VPPGDLSAPSATEAQDAPEIAAAERGVPSYKENVVID